MSSTTYETVTLSCAIWGYHVYRNVWQPKENETLQCDHESDNDYDLFVIKTCQDAEVHPQIVGHLPLEISWFTKFLPDCGLTITATLSSMHYWRSPLVQGGLEIPCVANAKLITTKKNKEIVAEYLEMVQTHYAEPSSDEDVIKGSFLVMSVNEDANIANCKDCTKCPNKGGKTNHWKMYQYLTPNLVVISELFFKEQSIKENKLLQKQKAIYPITLLNRT